MKWTILFLLFVGPLLINGQRSDFSPINFKKADSIALALKGESLDNLPVLTHKLTINLTTDVEKFRALYTWVSTNIENDYSSYLKTRKKRKKLSGDSEALLAWNNSFTPKVFENLLKYKKTACTGYAYLMRELASLANINCKIIDGYGRTSTLNLNHKSLPNHSWNAVQLNKKWYLCDPTWSAGLVILEENSPIFKSDYCEGYFLAEPALFAKNHYPLEEEWMLLSQPPSFNEFLDGPIVYKEAFSPTVIPLAPPQMKLEVLKNEPVNFKLSLPPKSENRSLNLLLVNNGVTKSAQPKISRYQDEYSLEYSFDKSGLYDVHIQMNDTIVATYVVKVKRK